MDAVSVMRQYKNIPDWVLFGFESKLEWANWKTFTCQRVTTELDELFQRLEEGDE